MNIIGTQQIDQSVLDLFTADQVIFYHLMPFKLDKNVLHIYVDEQKYTDTLINELEILVNYTITAHFRSEDYISNLQSVHYRNIKTDNRSQNEYYSGRQDDFVKTLLAEAKFLKSSDIHIEVYETVCRVRIRIDGVLIERYLIEKEVYPILINKIKILAHLDIAEKRLPQDGRIVFEENGEKTDLRVSIIPTLFGEKIVLRILNGNFSGFDLNHLGLSANDLSNYMKGIKKPNGIILISGPTGSGKTTTLYATLKHLNKSSRNIITIEDPIEYTMDGINQVQLKENIGLNFAAALRTFLRQDPDIIMVGEIRDKETANMAIRASLTGHLVLSTIHTNSAWGIVSRLIDMDIAPFLISSTLNTIAAQRLVRLLCPHCKKQELFDNTLLPLGVKTDIKIETHYTASGCPSCYNTGYKGRKAIYEIINIDDAFISEIKNSSQKVDALLEEKNIKPLSQNAFYLFSAGETSLDEILPLLNQ